MRGRVLGLGFLALVMTGSGSTAGGGRGLRLDGIAAGLDRLGSMGCSDRGGGHALGRRVSGARFSIGATSGDGVFSVHLASPSGGAEWL